ncbi:MAG: ABC transporter permease [Geminicoccaceae bacterium]
MRDPDLDLPLETTALGRFLLWLTAGLVFLCVLAFAVAAIADAQVTALRHEPRIVTVALPPNPEPTAARGEVDDVLEHVRALPGVAYASLIDETAFGELVDELMVDPAAGTADPTEDAADRATGGLFGARMPLPRLIDIAFNPGAAIDLKALDEDISALVPGATLGDSGQIEHSRERLAVLFRGVAGSFGLLLLGVTVVVVVWLTRAGLEAHRQTIDLLRQMGAGDRYLARQFEQHALAKALRGALLGFVVAISVVILVVYAPTLLGDAPLAAHELAPVHWVLLAMVPVVAALLATLVARLTAQHGLARLR